MITIFKKEFRAYLLSPIAYVFAASFFVILGIFFMLANINPEFGSNSDINYTLNNMKLVLLFIIPALTVKLLSEETKNKTDLLLFISPVNTTSVVLGKFFAASAIFLGTLIVSFIYPIILFKLGHPSLLVILNAYLGFFLLGLTFISICIFISSLTDNYVIGFIISFTSILSLWIIGFISGVIPNTLLSNIIDWISLIKRYEEFAGGILGVAPIAYYLSVISIFIFLTIKSLERKRIG